MPVEALRDLCVRNAMLLSACRRGAPAGIAPEELARQFDSWAEMRSLVDRLYAHRVPGLVLSVFDQCGAFEHVEMDARIALETHLLRQRRRSALMLIELERLGGHFGHAGIECAVLKGAGLSTVAYDAPEQRYMSDLDLLVRPEDFDRALPLLLDCGYENPWPEEAVRGYRRFHYHLPLVHPHGHICELHWDLVKPGRGYRLDAADVLEAATPVSAIPGSLRVPAPLHQMLHVFVQQLQDGFAYLVRSVDLDRLSARSNLDWDALVREAKRFGLAPAGAYALQLSRHLLATDCPAAVIHAMAPGALARTHLSLLDPIQAALDQRFIGHRTASKLLRLWLAPHASRRAMMLAELAHGADHEPLREPWKLIDREAHLNRRASAVGLLKLAVLQGWTYLQTIAGLPTRRGRAQMRFWSSQLSSSERL